MGEPLKRIVICLSYEPTSHYRSISLESAGGRYLHRGSHRDRERLWSQLTDILGLASMGLIFAIIGYVAEGVLGIPLLCLFRRINRMSLPWFLLGGFVVGVVVSIDDPLSFALLYCIAPAIISTAAFWFIGWSADNKAFQLTTR